MKRCGASRPIEIVRMPTQPPFLAETGGFGFLD